jgi:outer membrane receptor protein involved in Fe transport
MSSNPRLGPGSLVAAAIALVATQGALAQTALDEIVVTAQKRATSLQDVPFSIGAVSGEAISQSGANNVIELSRSVAGLIMTDLGPGQSQVAIRGISAGQVIRDQPGVKESVGIYLDESPISVALFTPDLDLFDLSRVEVLRGPQGTLFGAGSSSRARSTFRSATRPPCGSSATTTGCPVSSTPCIRRAPRSRTSIPATRAAAALRS